MLGLRRSSLQSHDGSYRFVDHANGEIGDTPACLLAEVPYSAIESVDMDGDERYHFPHIYCYFDFKGEPYKRKWLASEHVNMQGRSYCTELCDYDNAKKNTPQEGETYF